MSRRNSSSLGHARLLPVSGSSISPSGSTPTGGASPSGPASPRCSPQIPAPKKPATGGPSPRGTRKPGSQSPVQSEGAEDSPQAAAAPAASNPQGMRRRSCEARVQTGAAEDASSPASASTPSGKRRSSMPSRAQTHAFTKSSTQAFAKSPTQAFAKSPTQAFTKSPTAAALPEQERVPAAPSGASGAAAPSGASLTSQRMMFHEARAIMRKGGEEADEADNVSTMRRGMQAVRSALHRNLTRKAVADMWRTAAATHELKATEEETAQEVEEQRGDAEELCIQEVEEEVAEAPKDAVVASAEGAIDSFMALSSKLETIEGERPTMETVANTSVYVHKCANLLRQLRQRGYQNLRTTKEIGSSTEQNSEAMGRLISVMREQADGIQRALKVVQMFKNSKETVVFEVGTAPAPESKGKQFWFDAPQHDLLLLGILDEINSAIARVDEVMHFEKDGSKRPEPLRRPERLHSDASSPKRRSFSRHPTSQSDASGAGADAPAGAGKAEAPREEAAAEPSSPRAHAEDASKTPRAAKRQGPSAWAALPHLLRQRKAERAERLETVGQQSFNLESISRMTSGAVGVDPAPQEKPPDERRREQEAPLQDPTTLEQFIVAAAAAPLAQGPLPAVADHAAAPAHEEPRAARRSERKPSAPIRGIDDLSCEEHALLDSITGLRPGRAAPTPMAHRLRRCQDAAAAVAVGRQSFAEHVGCRPSLEESAGGCAESAGLSGRFRRTSEQPAGTAQKPRARKLPPLDLPSLLGMEKPQSARQSVSVRRVISVP